MKHFTKNLRWLFMSLLLVVGGNAWADEETVTFSEQGYTNAQAIESYEGTNFTVTFDKGTNSNAPKYYNTGSAIRMYGGNSMTISSNSKVFTKIELTFASSGDNSNAITTDVETYDNGTWTGSAKSIKFTVGGTSGHRRIVSVTVTTESGDTPSKNATTTTFNGESSYTITLGESFTAPTATVNVENAAVTYSSTNESVATVNETTGAVEIIAAGETTIKATYAGDDTYYGSSASYTLKVVSADLPAYTSLKELQDNVTATSTEIKLTFNDVFVTAVKNNNAWLSDGNYGALVYTNNHGLTAGQKLNGTINANLVLFRGQTEITGFSTDGLTITEEALAAKEVTDLSTITAANQSLLVTLKNVTYNGSVLADASGNTITPYTTFVSDLGLESGTSYDITGIVILYNTTLEIAPRTADDIVALSDEPEQKTDPESAWYTSEDKTEAVPATVSVDLSEGTLSYYFETTSEGTVSYTSSDENVATVNANGGITLVGAGTTTITATTAETDNFNSSEVSFTLTVTDESIVVTEEIYTLYTGEITSGDYIIVSQNDNSEGNAMKASVTSSRLDYKDFKITNNQISNSDASIVWTVSVNGEYYTLYNQNGYAASTGARNKAQLLEDGTDDKALWTITRTEDGKYEFINKANAAASVNCNLRNNGTYGFACYSTSTGYALTLYKKATNATEETATITSAGYTTFCPKADVSLPEAITAYTVSAISNGYATLTEVATIPAGTPVVLQGEAGEYALPIIEDAAAVGANLLKVSDGTVKGAANIYALANKDGVGFYPVSESVTIPAGKCYIETSAGEAAKERIDFDFGGATAIETIAVESTINSDVFYNLNGQRVMNPTKGIFIKNGKKVFIR